MKTARLTLRRLSGDDADALHAIMSDWQVVRQLGGWPWPPDPAFTRMRCDDNATKQRDIYGVHLNGALIGTVGTHKADLGYCFAQGHWGQGYAREASIAALDKAFTDAQCCVITASAWGDNDASVHVLQKLGFVEGTPETQHALARNAATLCRKFTLSSAAWLEGRCAIAYRLQRPNPKA